VVTRDPEAGQAQGSDEFVDALAELSFVIQGVLTRTGGKHDLSHTQLRLLGILRDRQPSMQQLAHRLGLDKSSVTGLIDRAERRGMVRRETDPSDGRAVRVVITALGRELARQAAAEIRDALTVVTDPLSATQRAQLVRAARVVVETARAAECTDSLDTTPLGADR
jgi:MarR family transcriptional regulator, lower aerobic nicotinate degradation pathway regulator